MPKSCQPWKMGPRLPDDHLRTSPSPRTDAVPWPFSRGSSIVQLCNSASATLHSLLSHSLSSLPHYLLLPRWTTPYRQQGICETEPGTEPCPQLRSCRAYVRNYVRILCQSGDHSKSGNFPHQPGECLCIRSFSSSSSSSLFSSFIAGKSIEQNKLSKQPRLISGGYVSFQIFSICSILSEGLFLYCIPITVFSAIGYRLSR